MPMYDIVCDYCNGIFERILGVGELHRATSCPYCNQDTIARPALSGSRVALQVVNSWRPRNRAEQLAGNGVAGPGMQTGAGRSSVLHNCKGFNCSICGV